MNKSKSKRKGGQSLPSSAVSLAQPTAWDMGAMGRANRANLVEEPRPHTSETGAITNPNGVKGVRRETWVMRYLRTGKLTTRQFMAALSMQDAAAGMPAQDPLSALSIDKGQGGSDPEAARVDARATFRRMWALVPQSSRPVLERVVLNDMAVWTGGRAQARHMERLAVGLDMVADGQDRPKR